MSLKKWLMKQYWRVSTIRTLLSLAMWMLVLGRLYYIFIPSLVEWGLFGALFLGAVLFSFFLFIGWIYDTRVRMWSPKMQASIERTPYRYVPNFRTKAFDYPVMYSLLCLFRSLFRKLDKTPESIDQAIDYFGSYFSLQPKKKDIQNAEVSAKSYMEENPFKDIENDYSGSIGIISKLKLRFEVQMLRLTWIQSLTGMVQDILVLAAFYVVLIFPSVAMDGTVPIAYLLLGIFLIAIPTFILIAGLGWYYDRQLKVWAADMVVKIERNPFTYVADLRSLAMEYPFFFCILKVMKGVLKNLDLNTAQIETLVRFLREYFNLRPKDKDYIEQVKRLRRDFPPLFSKKGAS